MIEVYRSIQKPWYERIDIDYYADVQQTTAMQAWRQVWRDKLQVWLKATAEWNDESRHCVSRYIRHARANGIPGLIGE